MSESFHHPSPIGAADVEPSAEKVLEPGTRIGDLFRRNMAEPYVLQRLSQRAWWVQSFNYGTIFVVGKQGCSQRRDGRMDDLRVPLIAPWS